MVPVQLGRYCCCKLWSPLGNKVLWKKIMKFIRKIIDRLLNSIVPVEFGGDMAEHRKHTTKYEDLCK